jgi:MFS family permease
LVFAAIFFVVEMKASEPVLPLKLFRNPIVSNALVVASLISAGMFGATLFIPLFVQSVIGRSATVSGTIITPMTLAIVGTAILSGQWITRMGRYRPMAISGIALTTVGTYLLARLNSSATYRTVIFDSIVVGLGMGIAFPVFNLAIQNAVEVRLIGTATSLAQFMRSMGAALGVAVFGSILSNQFAPAFHRAVPPEIAARIPAPVLARFDNPQVFMSAELAKRADAAFSAFGPQGHAAWLALQGAARTGLAVALQRVFLAATIVMLVATIVVLFLREIPLRKTNRPQEQAKLAIEEAPGVL